MKLKFYVLPSSFGESVIVTDVPYTKIMVEPALDIPYEHFMQGTYMRVEFNSDTNKIKVTPEPEATEPFFDHVNFVIVAPFMSEEQATTKANLFYQDIKRWEALNDEEE